MPPVVFLGLLAAAGFSAYRLLSSFNHKARTHASAERVRRTTATASPRDLGSLEWDETQGVYRPKPRRER